MSLWRRWSDVKTEWSLNRDSSHRDPSRRHDRTGPRRKVTGEKQDQSVLTRAWSYKRRRTEDWCGSKVGNEPLDLLRKDCNVRNKREWTHKNRHTGRRCVSLLSSQESLPVKKPSVSILRWGRRKTWVTRTLLSRRGRKRHPGLTPPTITRDSLCVCLGAFGPYRDRQSRPKYVSQPLSFTHVSTSSLFTVYQDVQKRRE